MCIRDRSQIECKKADKGEAEQVNSSVGLTQNTVYLKVRFSCDGKKIKASEGGNDLIVICNFSYSLDGKKFLPLGNPFQAREGQWIGAKVGMFCTRPAIVTNDGGWTCLLYTSVIGFYPRYYFHFIV